METKVQNKNGRKLYNQKIVRVFLNRVMDYNAGKVIIRGHILLQGGVFIQIAAGKYYIVIDGIKKGVVLKTSPNYRIVKRIIATEFKTFRIGPKSFLREKIGTLRAAAVNGQYNCNLFRISGISFKQNRSNFLKRAS